MRLDQIVTPLPVVGAVFDTGDHSGTNQTGAAYLAATAQMASSVVTLIVGKLLKLILVERLFRVTPEKLMKIAAAAICIGLRCAYSS